MATEITKTSSNKGGECVIVNSLRVFVRTMYLCDYSGVASHSELPIANWGYKGKGVWRFQPFLHGNDLADTPFQPIQILQYFMIIS